MDREILEKYIDLEKSCLMEKERKIVMDMLNGYKGAFSLRDEIGNTLIACAYCFNWLRNLSYIFTYFSLTVVRNNSEFIA